VPEDEPPPVPTAPIPQEAPAKFPRHNYDFVPADELPPPSAPTQPSSHKQDTIPVLAKQPGYQYDYVPDEPPPSIPANNFSRPQYEEPPYEVRKENPWK
jgi:hypothetical protein